MKSFRIAFALLLLTSSACDAKRNSDVGAESRVVVSAVNAEAVEGMVSGHQKQLHRLLPAQTDEITSDYPDQSFRLTLAGKSVYMVSLAFSVSESLLGDSCALAVFDQAEIPVDAMPTFNSSELAWSCDDVLGVGFRGKPSAPSAVDIVIIYQGRPPSNREEDLFSYPVKLTFDFRTGELALEKDLSKYLLDKGVNTVDSAFNVLAKRAVSH